MVLVSFVCNATFLISHPLRSALLHISPAALCGVVMYNYIKVRDVRASQITAESIPDRITKVSS
jgi:hypothetical protein